MESVTSPRINSIRTEKVSFYVRFKYDEKKQNPVWYVDRWI